MNQPQIACWELSRSWSGNSGVTGTDIVTWRHSMPARSVPERPHNAVDTNVPPVGAVVLPWNVVVAEPSLFITTVGAVVIVTPGRLAAESNFRSAIAMLLAMPRTS